MDSTTVERKHKTNGLADSGDFEILQDAPSQTFGEKMTMVQKTDKAGFTIPYSVFGALITLLLSVGFIYGQYRVYEYRSEQQKQQLDMLQTKFDVLREDTDKMKNATEVANNLKAIAESQKQLLDEMRTEREERKRRR